jgi:hypothetical protein
MLAFALAVAADVASNRGVVAQLLTSAADSYGVPLVAMHAPSLAGLIAGGLIAGAALVPVAPAKSGAGEGGAFGSAEMLQGGAALLGFAALLAAEGVNASSLF